MEKKFTQGEWYAVDYAGFVQIQTSPNYDDGGLNVLDADAVGAEQAEANAKLIAAAPDLLEALQVWQAANALGDAQMLADARIKRDIALKKAI